MSDAVDPVESEAIKYIPQNYLETICSELKEPRESRFYRELMDVNQLGLYSHENGFDVRRAGVIKVHNGLIMKVRDTP